MLPTIFPVRRVATALLLLALPLAATAQNAHQDSLLRRGDLVGARPAAARRVPDSAPRAAAFPATSADPVLARLLHERVDPARVPASQLPDLYDRFLEAVRAERRQWSAREWEEAGGALARLNARYEQVRQQLPLDERLSVRGAQGEFQTLRSARRVKDRLDGGK